MTATLAAAGARVDGWFHCPHHPTRAIAALRVDCDCRKPRPGMIRQAVARFDIDLARSFVVGDKWTDVGLADERRCARHLVRTGYGERARRRMADGARRGLRGR